MNNIKSCKQTFISLLAIIILMSGCATLPEGYQYRESGHFSAGRFVVSEKGDTCFIEMRSDSFFDTTNPINANSIAAFTEAVEHIINSSCSRKIVNLSSYGGSVLGATKIGYIIRNNNLDTQIKSGEPCYSACTLIFISGNKRYIDTKSTTTKLGFHQASLERGAFRNKCAAKLASIDKYTLKMLDQASADEFIRLTHETDCNEMRYISAEAAFQKHFANKLADELRPADHTN